MFYKKVLFISLLSVTLSACGPISSPPEVEKEPLIYGTWTKSKPRFRHDLGDSDNIEYPQYKVSYTIAENGDFTFVSKNGNITKGNFQITKTYPSTSCKADFKRCGAYIQNFNGGDDFGEYNVNETTLLLENSIVIKEYRR
jgi:hypothetical protein